MQCCGVYEDCMTIVNNVKLSGSIVQMIHCSMAWLVISTSSNTSYCVNHLEVLCK